MMKAKFTRAERIAHKLSWQQRAELRALARGRGFRKWRTAESLFRKGLLDSSVHPLRDYEPELTPLGREVYDAIMS
jgi:hypothetical protein